MGEPRNIPIPDQQTKERFVRYYQESAGCWEWQGALTRSKRRDGRGGVFIDGYGTFGMSGRMYKAHRISYVIAFGPIPRGLMVLHRCDNPRCVRPDHLTVGTHTDNVRDMHSKGRHRGGGSPGNRNASAPGERNPNAKLSRRDVDLIRNLYADGGHTMRSLGERFGVHNSTIARIISSRGSDGRLRNDQQEGIRSPHSGRGSSTIREEHDLSWEPHLREPGRVDSYSPRRLREAACCSRRLPTDGGAVMNELDIQASILDDIREKARAAQERREPLTLDWRERDALIDILDAYRQMKERR